MDQLNIPASVRDAIRDTIGRLPAETGGIFAVRNHRVEDFYFDVSAGTHSHYRPTEDWVNEIAGGWLQEGMDIGFLHSHRSGRDKLSPMDLNYADTLLRENPQLARVYMGIFCDGALQLYKITAPRSGRRHGTLEFCDLRFTDDKVILHQFRPEPPAWFQEAVREIISKLEEVTEETQ